MFLHLPSLIFFPCLTSHLFLHAKKCVPLIFICIFYFSEAISRSTSSILLKLLPFLPLFFFSSFSSLRAAVCPLSSSGWSPSGDLGHAEILIDGETSLQTLLEMLPVISHHWHQHALEVHFFRACEQWNGDFIRVLLLPYQLLRVNASKTEQLLAWDSMKWLFEALLHLFVFGRHSSSGLETALFNSFTQSVTKRTPGMDLGVKLPSVTPFKWLVWKTCAHLSQ